MAAPGRKELIEALRQSWEVLARAGGDLDVPMAVRERCLATRDWCRSELEVLPPGRRIRSVNIVNTKPLRQPGALFCHPCRFSALAAGLRGGGLGGCRRRLAGCAPGHCSDESGDLVRVGDHVVGAGDLGLGMAGHVDLLLAGVCGMIALDLARETWLIYRGQGLPKDFYEWCRGANIPITRALITTFWATGIELWALCNSVSRPLIW